MQSGLTSRISEEGLGLTTTIRPTSDLVHVLNTTSTTVLSTIQAPFLGLSGILLLVNRSGSNFTTVTNGNIATARTIPQNQVVVFAYSQETGKFYVGATN